MTPAYARQLLGDRRVDFTSIDPALNSTLVRAAGYFTAPYGRSAAHPFFAAADGIYDGCSLIASWPDVYSVDFLRRFNAHLQTRLDTKKRAESPVFIAANDSPSVGTFPKFSN